MTHHVAGKTPLFKIDALASKFGYSNLLIKDESKNPFGTWKDRRSSLIVRRAEENFVDKICLITSGNAGFSLAKFAAMSPLKITAIIDHQVAKTIHEKLAKACYSVIEKDLSQKIFKPEECLALAREQETEIIWEATNGWHEAYESIIQEIKSTKPDYLICPVGSGEAYVGLCNGIVRAKLKTKLIGIKSKANPSYADKLHTPWTPYSPKIRSILDLGHALIQAEEDEIKTAYALARDHIDCEPSSAIVFVALSKLKFKKNDRIVLVNSGKGLVS